MYENDENEDARRDTARENAWNAVEGAFEERDGEWVRREE